MEEKKEVSTEVTENRLNELGMPITMKDKLIMARAMITSRLLPSEYDSPEKVLIALMAGQEIGLPPVAAVYCFDIVKGRPKLSVKSRMSLLRSHKQYGGMVYEEEEGVCTVTITRILSDKIKDVFIASYSMEEAGLAGLLGKDNWKHHARTMLRRRAVGFAVDELFPEINFFGIGGASDENDYNNGNGGPIQTDAVVIAEPKKDEKKPAEKKTTRKTTKKEPAPKEEEPAGIPVKEEEVIPVKVAEDVQEKGKTALDDIKKQAIGQLKLIDVKKYISEEVFTGLKVDIGIAKNTDSVNRILNKINLLKTVGEIAAINMDHNKPDKHNNLSGKDAYDIRKKILETKIDEDSFYIIKAEIEAKSGIKDL